MKETFKTIGKVTAAVALAAGVLFGTGKAIQSAPEILDEINSRNYEVTQVQEKKAPRELEGLCKVGGVIRGSNPYIKDEVRCLIEIADKAAKNGKPFGIYLDEARFRTEKGPYLPGYVDVSFKEPELKKYAQIGNYQK